MGKGLQAAGHWIRFITFESFASLVAENELDFHLIHGDAQSLVANAGADTLALVRSFRSLAESYARDLSASRLGETDLLINQLPIGLYGFDLAEKHHIPMVLASVIPLIRTQAFPLMGFPKLPLAGYNQRTYDVGALLAWQMFRPVINRWRRKTLGLPPLSFHGYLEQLAQVPVLCGFSGHVVLRPNDWQEHVHIMGYWFPEDKEWEPPSDLSAFLEAGPPPVFIGFGSMPVKYPERTTEMILEALRQTGQRAVLHIGWGGLGTQSLPTSVFKIDYAPYEWLFPRMSMIIHHGGSGTTGFALRAGVPSCVIPFLFDQFYWGERISQLGVGPKPVAYKNLTVARLRQAIEVGLGDPQIKHNAKKLGQKIQAENGIERAVRVLEKMNLSH